MFEDAHDNCKPNRDLGSSDSHDKENEHLSRCLAETATDCHKGEIRGIQHQFDTHKDDNSVPADEDPDNSRCEQKCTQYEIVL